MALATSGMGVSASRRQETDVQLTLEQVSEMAPDPGAAAAGKKLTPLKNWESLGRNADALWGVCLGSAKYQVKVDLSNLGYHCSCPSRKFPCKHVLGLLMLAASSPDAVAESAPSEWLCDWLERRQQRAEKKAERAEATSAKPVDEKAQQRRVEQREARVAEGLQRFDIWMKDLVRNGLTVAETQPASFWEEQAKRLVDAQAPGLASRVSRLAAIPRSSRDWPARLLAELGRLKLLMHAWQRINHLTPQLQADVRQLLGWTASQADLELQGERVEDRWVIAGQWLDDEDRIRVQRSWLVGRSTCRTALVLQFAAPGQGFPESIVPGSEQEATVIFYPGAERQRARLLERRGAVESARHRPPGHATIEELLHAVALSLARQPWLSAFGAMLHDVTLLPPDDGWLVRDAAGQALPLTGRDHWKFLAVSGGRPFDLAGEWNGQALRPLGAFFDGSYRVA